MRKGFLAGAAVAVGLFALALSDPATERVGYFKSDDPQSGATRVAAYTSDTVLEPTAIRNALDRTPVSEGRLSVAVYYPPGAAHPGESLTLAADAQAALALIYDTPEYEGWTHRLTRNGATGEVRFEPR